MREEPDYYEILQVSPKAEPAVIDAAYRRLARKYHPDVNPSSAAHSRMRELNRALEILMDPRRRADYDRRRLRLIAQKAMAEKPTTIAAPARPPELPAKGPWQRLRSLPAAWLAIVGGVAAIVAAAVLLVWDSDGAGPRQQSGREVTPAVAGATQEQGGATFSDGTWLVGEEISPGIWRAVRPRACAWKRLASIEGATDAVASSGSYLTVEIPPTDAAFSSEGCGWWTQVLTPPSESPTEPFGPGTWLVPEEVAPGKWQNSDSSEGCAWTMLSGLDGEPSAVIASGVTYEPATMELTGNERAFDSRGCGTWSRMVE